MSNPKMLRHFEVSSSEVHVDLEHTTADAHFLAKDGTPIVLTMRLRALEMLQGNIERALASVPPSKRWESAAQTKKNQS